MYHVSGGGEDSDDAVAASDEGGRANSRRGRTSVS